MSVREVENVTRTLDFINLRGVKLTNVVPEGMSLIRKSNTFLSRHPPDIIDTWVQMVSLRAEVIGEVAQSVRVG